MELKQERLSLRLTGEEKKLIRKRAIDKDIKISKYIMDLVEKDINSTNNNLNIENNENVLDLSNKQDLEKFHQYIDELKGNKIFTAFAKYFGCNLDESFNALHQFADDYYADCQKEQKDKTPVFEYPSQKLSIDDGLQVHKLVQEYVDTMIKPFNNRKLTNDQINNAYVGLYEFCSWLLLHD